jgi:hypothetical protein
VVLEPCSRRRKEGRKGEQRRGGATFKPPWRQGRGEGGSRCWVPCDERGKGGPSALLASDRGARGLTCGPQP